MDIKQILELHKQWLADPSTSKKANLHGVDLHGVDLRGVDLSCADLLCANLRDVDLSDANLSYANLSCADLSNADLRYANLSCADLRDVDLCDADLCGAKLWGCVGNSKEIKTIQDGRYTITYTKHAVQIGCQQHTWAEWCSFDDNTISKMGNGALKWWKVWKPILTLVMEHTHG